MFFVSLSLQAQIGIPYQNAIWTGSEPTVDGSPYLENSWKMGTVTDRENEREYRVFLKYDTRIDRIVVSFYGRPAILDDIRYPEFTIGGLPGSDYEERKFLNATQLEIAGLEGYYEMLYMGEYRLLRKVRTDYIPNTIPEYGTHRKTILFLTREEFLLIDPDGFVKEVPDKTRHIFRLFGPKAGEYERLAEDRQLDVSKPEGLVELLRLHESGGS